MWLTTATMGFILILVDFLIMRDQTYQMYSLSGIQVA